MGRSVDSADFLLSRDHYREGMRRMSAAILAGPPRRSRAGIPARFALCGFLGALLVSGLRAAAQVTGGADPWAAGRFAVRTTLLATVLIAASGLLWFGWREWRLRRRLAKMKAAVEMHFDPPAPVRIGWGGGELSWDGAEGVGGMPLNRLHAYDDDAALLLLYLGPYFFLPVPLGDLGPARAESLRRALAEAGVPDRWTMPVRLSRSASLAARPFE